MKYKGCQGVVKTGAAADQILELFGFSVDESVTVLDASVIGDGGLRDVRGGLKSWTGTIDVYYDPDDTGIANMLLGEIVQLEMYPSGEDPDNIMLSGSALIASVGTPVEIEGVIQQSYAFEGSRALTKTLILPEVVL